MQAPNHTIRLEEDRLLLHQAVQEAGILATEKFRNGARSWEKGDGSPVSQADLDVSNRLREILCGPRPDYGWLSEEEIYDDKRLGREFVWIADPIDGTSSFLEGGDKWSIAVALLRNGRPIIASVYRPLTNEHYKAAIGKGATLNESPIAVSERTTLSGAKIVAYQKSLRSDRWQRPWPDMQHGMATSLALRLCMVAAGKFDLAVSIGRKHDWDLAAGDLIVSEAGGRVSNFAGAVPRYNQRELRQDGLVATNNALHEDVVSHTSSFR